MRIIGILGGVASGKSAVAGHFARLGAGVLDADQAGREALELPNVKEAARHRWGDGIFDAEGQIDRGRLAALVFGSTDEAVQERKYLEELVHPEIGRLLQRQAAALRASGLRAAVLDAPLLIEAGWSDWCDKMVLSTRLASCGSVGLPVADGPSRSLTPARRPKNPWNVNENMPM